MQDPMDTHEHIDELIASVRAPHALREHIAAEHDRTLVRRTVVRRMKVTGTMAGFAAALGVVVALLAPSGNTTAPGPLTAAALAARAPTGPAPAVDPAHPGRLQVSAGGVAFPTWTARFALRASGQRTDTLAGRATRTVFYDDARGVRLGYTIVDGAALAWPGGSRRLVSNGVEEWVLRRGARLLVFWREHGHTCVINAPSSVSQARVVALAAHDVYAS